MLDINVALSEWQMKVINQREQLRESEREREAEAEGEARSEAGEDVEDSVRSCAVPYGL